MTSHLHFAYSRGKNKLFVFHEQKKVRYQHEVDDLAYCAIVVLSVIGSYADF